MKKKYMLLLIAVVTFSACEKDDICDSGTPTTPRLVIEFFDKENPAVPKAVRNLKVVGDGMPEGLILNEAAAIEAQRYLSNGTKIAIPLKTLEDHTKYTFIYEFGNANTALTYSDTIEFNYTRKDEYVSRACGFKTLFTLNPDGNAVEPVIINNDPDLETGNWINSIEVLESDVKNENETHVKIFF